MRRSLAMPRRRWPAWKKWTVRAATHHDGGSHPGRGAVMAAVLMGRTVSQLRHWAEAPARGVADDELLQQFEQARDERAFAELVRRYGGMVRGVAWRVVGDHHAA